VLYDGLPDELCGIIIHFNEEERWNNFKAVLECTVTLHAAITVESANEHQSIMRASTMVLEEQKDLPSEDQFQQMIQRNNIWKQGDPSPFYDIYS